MFIEWVLWGVSGLIIGSFVNVLILRHGEKSILGRSACSSCKTTLQWFELVPLLSWVIQRGRCRTCSARISIQYPLVEALTAVGFIVVGLAPIPLEIRLIAAAIVALFVAITVYDFYHTIIPDVWSYSFAGLALITLFISPFLSGTWYLLLFSGPIVALPLFCLWFFSGGTWMGLGDVKLALGIGWLLGALDGYVALGLAFFIGAVVGVFILLPLPHIATALARAGITRGFRAETFTMKSEVPFGPFLICATLLVWFSQLYDLGLVEFLTRTLAFA